MSFWKKQAPAEGAVPAVPQSKRKLSGKKIALLLALAVLAVGATAGWKVFFAPEEKEIRTGETSRGSLTASIQGTGVALPQDSVSYSTASDSEILEVLVSAGDTVQVGDLLYRQDDSALEEELDDYRDQIAENEDNLTTYAGQLADLEEEMANLRVTAPFAGRLQSVQAKVGDTVRVGDTLATLVDDSSMVLTQYFSYSYEEDIHLGMNATVSIPDLMRSFTGTVTDIQKVERITPQGVRTFAVTVTIPNPGALTEAMAAGGFLTAEDGTSIYPSVEGALEYAATQTITAQAAGKLTACHGVDYQMVEKGSVLFTIDGSTYETQEKNLNTQITRAQDKIATLTQRIADSEEKRANYEVRSQVAGTVIFCNVKVGDKPQTGRTAVLVYNLEAMKIQVNIDELDIEYIKNGMEVTILRSGAETSQMYTGTVTEVSLEASNENGVSTFPVTIHIPSNGDLAAGVSVSYFMNTGDTEEGVLAPVNAVQYTDEGTCLFVKRESRPAEAVDLEGVDIPEGFYAIPVETGTSNAQSIRILSGVEEGETLFLGYRQSAPANGSSTSEGDGSTEMTPGGNIQVMPGMSFESGSITVSGGAAPMRPRS